MYFTKHCHLHLKYVFPCQATCFTSRQRTTNTLLSIIGPQWIRRASDFNTVVTCLSGAPAEVERSALVTNDGKGTMARGKVRRHDSHEMAKEARRRRHDNLTFGVIDALESA